jgi:hypothetical protein
MRDQNLLCRLKISSKRCFVWNKKVLSMKNGLGALLLLVEMACPSCLAAIFPYYPIV